MSKPNLDWKESFSTWKTKGTSFLGDYSAIVFPDGRLYPKFGWKIHCFNGVCVASGLADTQEEAKEAVLRWLYPYDAEKLQKVADAAYQEKEDITVIAPPGEVMSKPNLDWKPDILNSITAYTPSIRATIKASPMGHDTFRDEKEYRWWIFNLSLRSGIVASGRTDTQAEAKEAVLKWLYPFDGEKLQKVADAAYQAKEDVFVIGPPGEMVEKGKVSSDRNIQSIPRPVETVHDSITMEVPPHHDPNIQNIPKFTIAIPWELQEALKSARQSIKNLQEILDALSP